MYTRRCPAVEGEVVDLVSWEDESRPFDFSAHCCVEPERCGEVHEVALGGPDDVLRIGHRPRPFVSGIGGSLLHDALLCVVEIGRADRLFEPEQGQIVIFAHWVLGLTLVHAKLLELTSQGDQL